MAVKTFAAIDVGSFELSMKIYEVSSKNGMKQIDHIRRSIDLGTETYNVGKLCFERVEELCQTLKEFHDIMDSYGVKEYKAYGTSAIREAKNTTILLDQVKQRTGIDIGVLSNSEQRFLDYKSIAFQGKKFDRFIEQGACILDVGGAGIQISCFDNKKLVSTQGMKLGVLRIQDRMNTLKVSLGNYSKFVTELCESALNTYKKLYIKENTIDNLIIFDDHISMLVNRSDDIVAGDMFTLETVEKYLDMASSKNRYDVAKELAVATEELPLIYISLLLLHQVMLTMGASRVWAPGSSLCDGIAYEYAEKNGLVSTVHDFDEDIRSCALQISKRYNGSRKRAETIEGIALAIFDEVSKTHGLTARDRLLLQISAILHDCGKYISMANLAECSYSIIKNTEIIGISHKERIMVANIVKYNQTIFDYYEDFEDYNEISRPDHMRIAKLTAILRVANGLDRSHKMKFKNVKAEIEKDRLILNVETNEDITLEKGLFTNRADFFEEVYNLVPVIKQKRSI